MTPNCLSKSRDINQPENTSMRPEYTQRPDSLESGNPDWMQIDSALHLEAATHQPRLSYTPHEPPSQVRLSRLDGTPYVVSRKLRKAESVEDAHNGQQSPGHKNMSSYANLRQLGSLFHVSRKMPCGTCGTRQSTRYGSNDLCGVGPECRRCSKRSVTNPLPARTPTMVPKPRSTSDGSSTTLINTPILSYNASNDASEPKRACNKCGRKRKATLSKDGTTESRHHSLGVANQHTMSTNVQTSPPQPPSGIFKRKLPSSQTMREQPPTVLADATLPATVSERPRSSGKAYPGLEPFPLLRTKSQRMDLRSYRNISVSSLASSIVRSISKHHKRSQDHTEEFRTGSAANQDNGSGTDSLIDMIANAIRGNQEQDYSRLIDETDVHQRSSSPFSFVGGERHEAIELENMRRSSPVAETPFVGQQAHMPLFNSTIDNPFDDREGSENSENSDIQPPTYSTLLEAPRLSKIDSAPRFASEAPELVRFKSLKSGMQRAGSLARSTSLKRLDSLKNVAKFWYSTDMSTECTG